MLTHGSRKTVTKGFTMFFLHDADSDGRKVICVGTASLAISRLERMMQKGVMPKVVRLGGTAVNLEQLVREVAPIRRDDVGDCLPAIVEADDRSRSFKRRSRLPVEGHYS